MPPKKRSRSSSSGDKRKRSSSIPRNKRMKLEEVWWKSRAGHNNNGGAKWRKLEHNGPVFTPPYKSLPRNVHFKYKGKIVQLSRDAEEIAGFYARLLQHDCTKKALFNRNFLNDWRKSMTKGERAVIKNVKKCDFRDMYKYYTQKAQERKAMSKGEKLKIKKENEAIAKKYGEAVIDEYTQKIGNFKVEPPGLFMGRGNHPKMGMVKRRINPEDVIINCSKRPKPPLGRKWKEVRHDNAVTWLACWRDNITGKPKYVQLNQASRIKGEKDRMKYENARKLAKHIGEIREKYRADLVSKEKRLQQRAVAMYFIDKLALRAGNEKDEDTADTVGCCSLRCEHIKLKKGNGNAVLFDFLGKDSIRYCKKVAVEKLVYNKLKTLMENKKNGDALFDALNTSMLNKHLNDLMPGLTTKVFRTYNASHTLQQQLDKLTPAKGTVTEKMLAYNRANRAVAILCNHQRAVPKSFEKTLQNLDKKIKKKNDEIKRVQKDLMRLGKRKEVYHTRKTGQLKRLNEQVQKLKMTRTDKQEGKEIAPGTSKLNYMDPRISVAWCEKHKVPIEKVYNKTQRGRFRWAIEGPNRKSFRFG